MEPSVLMDTPPSAAGRAGRLLDLLSSHHRLMTHADGFRLPEDMVRPSPQLDTATAQFDEVLSQVRRCLLGKRNGLHGQRVKPL